ncbi:ABC transporter ATP-binding protein [Nocardioides carbamazepini]|uniref:ABC transporter ATP-binding protein n=1 Tax=Nocardioides carbamazepini TaxID=2854259 RepID=UPI00214A7B61|nr:ABC transporter ATP-binding protein [Nocardioides carbamazepini]MCR1785848.1 ABC transporter ATP-binding protein [Nocardioides carbamazepini]
MSTETTTSRVASSHPARRSARRRSAAAPKAAAPGSATSADPVLVADRLSVRYRLPGGHLGPAVVSDVSLTITAGERVAVVGESGSGKSTLALAVAGFLGTQQSEVTLDRLAVMGRDVPAVVGDRLPRARDGVTMMFQDAMTSLDPVWTVGSQLRAVVGAREEVDRRDRQERCRHWLRRVGLADTERVMAARPGELSGGMRQRVMMAIALASGPRLLIADEPTSALDAGLAREVMELLLELTEQSRASALVVTHDITLVSEYVDRIAVMYRGEIVEVLSARRLAAAQHPYTRALLACVPTLASAGLDRLPTLADFDVISPDAA